MKTITSTLTATIIAGAMACSASVQAAEDVVIVYDASGSMWGQIDGVSKVEIAREVMGDLITKWPDDTNLGLVAYGHRRKGDCSDIETLIAPAPLDKSGFIQTINNIRPNGKTPISASLQHAADLMSYRDSQATIVLISDGLETCHADPCALSAELAKQGVKLTTHVVGFDLETEAHANLSCIAENAGGLFVPANNAAELHDALAQVQSAVAAPPPEVDIFGPEQVETGATFDVSWSTPVNERDFINLVPVGADKDSLENYIRTENKTEGRLTAPGEPGLYELRYVLEAGKKTLASTPVEVVRAETSVSGPEKVTVGATFDVSWSTPVNDKDFINLVPVGAGEGSLGNYIRTKNKMEGSLTAPGEPGLYELRYMLEAGRKTLASSPVEVVSAEIEISGPDIARAQTDVDVTWSGTVNTRDFIVLVPFGADEGSLGTYIRAKNKTEGRLEAPDEPGLYELRYVLEVGRKTLATAPLEVVSADTPLNGSVDLVVPSKASKGEVITIEWAGTADSSDQRMSLARKDQPDFSWISVQSVAEEKVMELIMPDEAGIYEIRFLDVAGRKLLDRKAIEVE
ncbi:VWA domain-containing protein [Marinobacter sp. S6332]|uniref:VWA domain-containing protein n=1 Tax=Marinobacter sp. S6332 TaxID=2926403 RepID=UPI001FF2140C|nr:VWA domain-containing protein [Marinobacter sp. S6332]MCK0165194.1 VWA domain-containing protein [Marinobacter sp. S6332]